MKKYTKKIVSILTALVMVLGLTLVGNTSTMTEVKAAPFGTYVNVADYPNGIDEGDLIEGNYYQVGIKVLNSWGLMFSSDVDGTNSVETAFVNGGYTSLTLLKTYESGKEVEGVNYTTDSNTNVTVTTPSEYWRYMDIAGNGDCKFIPAGSLSVDGDVKCYGMIGEKMIVSIDETKDTKVFDEWSGTDGLTFTYGNENSHKIEFIMPNRNVELVSSYKEDNSSGNGGQHQHMYLGYKTDDTHHWRECDCGAPDGVTPKEAHNDANNNGKCDVCDKDMNTSSGGGTGTDSGTDSSGTVTGNNNTSSEMNKTDTKTEDKTGAPQTGDLTSTFMWVLVAMASVSVIIGVAIKKRRGETEF